MLSYEIRIPASMVDATLAVGDKLITGMGLWRYKKANSGAVGWGNASVKCTLAAEYIAPVRNVPYTNVAPTLDGDITTLEWGASEWRIDPNAANICADVFNNGSSYRMFVIDQTIGPPEKTMAQMVCFPSRMITVLLRSLRLPPVPLH